jgi:hypothetical protein
MPAARSARAFACLLLAGGALAGCGGGSDTTSAGPSGADTAPSAPAPPKASFPPVAGKTLRQLVKSAEGGPAQLAVSPQAMVFYPGASRYPFEVFEHHDRKPVSDAEVAIYFARVPKVKAGAHSRSGNKGQIAKAQAQALDQPAIGPFPARIESLATKPRFRSETTAGDPEAAKVIYSAQIPFPRAGEWAMAAIVREEGETRGTLLPGVDVGEFKKVPRPGDPAPVIHTPTAQDVGGDLAKITTRMPPDTLNRVDFAEALGKEPIVLLFATPRFCQSRVCGSVVDVAEQAEHEYGDKAAFIHMEIYDHNDPADFTLPQVRRFHLPSEPWLFTINRRGDVSAAVEGGFGLELIHKAIDKAVSG